MGRLPNAIAHAKAIAFAKCSVWVKTYKCHKHVKNHSTRPVEVFCEKNGSKKRQILEKWDNFENHPSCKGYSLCKMVSLGQKSQTRKLCEKPVYKHIKFVLCKKVRFKKRQMFQLWHNFEIGQKHAKNHSTRTAQLFLAKNGSKNTKYWRNETISKIGHLAKAIAFAKWLV